jgi:hypothetical protein
LCRVAACSRRETSIALDGWRDAQRAIDGADLLAPEKRKIIRLNGMSVPPVPARSVGGGSQAFLPMTMQFVMPCAFAFDHIAGVRTAAKTAIILIVDLVICLLPKRKAIRTHSVGLERKSVHKRDK